MQVVIDQVQNELQRRKYFHVNRKVAVLRANPLLELSAQSHLPHSVGQIRQHKLLKPRILKTGTDKKNSLFTQSGSNSLCNLQCHFKDM